jgi:hypothetical protein
MNHDYPIKWKRLFFALAFTMVLADTAPHPNLAPGVLQFMFESWQNYSPRVEASSAE